MGLEHNILQKQQWKSLKIRNQNISSLIVPNCQTFETIMKNSATDETAYKPCLNNMVYPIIRWCFCFFGGTGEWYEGSLGLIGGECKKKWIILEVFLLVNLSTLKDRDFIYNFDILAIIYGALTLFWAINQELCILCFFKSIRQRSFLSLYRWRNWGHGD